LAAITAATLGQNLSKEYRISSWNASELSRDQQLYAALDAWILLSIYDYLHVLPRSGEALKSASQTGQLVSLFCKNQEIAQGVVIQQPRDFNVH
jgi:ribonuclease D